MVDITQLFNPDGDLAKPPWFYQHVEFLADDCFDHLKESLEACPFGALTYDHLYNAIAQTPVRLMAIAMDDREMERYIVENSAARLWMQACTK